MSLAELQRQSGTLPLAWTESLLTAVGPSAARNGGGKREEPEGERGIRDYAVLGMTKAGREEGG